MFKVELNLFDLLFLDLKPENVLLTFNSNSNHHHEPNQSHDYNYSSLVQVKLCDFGVSSKFKRKIMLSDFCGSPGFFAPEMITQGYYYGDKADIWSIGCILLEMALGHRRFCLFWMRSYSYDVIQNATKFHSRIGDSLINLLTDGILQISPAYKDFLLRFLRLKDSERSSFKKLSTHDWLDNLFHVNNSENNSGIDEFSIHSSSDRHPGHLPDDLDVSYDFQEGFDMNQLASLGGGSPLHSTTNHSSPKLDDMFNMQLLGQLNELESSLDNQTSSDNTDSLMSPFLMPPAVNWKNLLGGNVASPITSNGANTPHYDLIKSQSHLKNKPFFEVPSIVRVLLVEDSAFQRKLMAKRLHSVGLISDGTFVPI